MCTSFVSLLLSLTMVPSVVGYKCQNDTLQIGKASIKSSKINTKVILNFVRNKNETYIFENRKSFASNYCTSFSVHTMIHQACCSLLSEISSIVLSLSLSLMDRCVDSGEENASPIRKKNETDASPKLSRAATTIAEEAVDQLQASEKLIAGMSFLKVSIQVVFI